MEPRLQGVSATNEGATSAGVSGEPHEGEILAGKYLIERLIGEGGMGKVFAGVNQLTGKRVALKWLCPDSAQREDALLRFRREALAAGRIDHPNVIQVYDVIEEPDGSIYMVMERLRGEPLSELAMRTSGVLPVEDAVAILIPAMRGIAAAHAEGVVHRDLKPENIFLCEGPEGGLGGVKVLDFGVSKLANEPESLSITTTGMVVGTPYYMSPEQVRGRRDLDERVDVYAMGVVLYELLAGRPPFDADSYSALMIEIATGTAPPLHALREVDPELEKVIDEAMARDREERFVDIASFAVALQPFGRGITFRQTHPDGSAHISIGGAKSEPFRSRGRVSSRAQTALLGGTTGAEVPGPPWADGPGAAGMGSTGVRPTGTGAAAPSATTGPSGGSRRALWVGFAVGLGVALLLGAAAVLLRPRPNEAVEPAAGAPARTASPASAHQGTPAPAKTPAANPAPPETTAAKPSSAGPTSVQPASAPATPPAKAAREQARRARLERLARQRAAKRAQRNAAKGLRLKTPPASSTTPRTNRAGNLSLDDF